jgi:hypothetical protein
MIQIRQTKDDLTAKGLLILLAHTSGLHAAGMLGRVSSILSGWSGKDCRRVHRRFAIKRAGLYIPVEDLNLCVNKIDDSRYSAILLDRFIWF